MATGWRTSPIEAAVWAELALCAARPRPPLARGRAGHHRRRAADARSVVLRDVDARRALVFYADSAPQGAQIAGHPPAPWCCGRPEAELAAAAAVQLVAGDVRAWWCRRAGRAEDVAGRAGLPVAAAARQRLARRCPSAAAREHFGVVTAPSTPSTGWNCTPTATAAPPSTTRARAG
jgi:hypothetical protein